MKKILTTLIFLGLILGTGFVEAKSGCCSWHGGVKANGCGCNDGTSLSATCAPHYTCSNVSNTSFWNTNFDKNCGNWWTPFEKSAKNYFASMEYKIDKESWRKKLTGCNNFLKREGCDYDGFLNSYEYFSLSIGSILDDTECHAPFKKLPEYISDKIKLYNEYLIEQKSLPNRLKKIWHWF